MSTKRRVSYTIRKARMGDVQSIYSLVARYAKRGLMLPRSLSELYENMRDFFVCEGRGQLRGCCALHIVWDELGEVKSLAVAPRYVRRGIGRQLVDSCLSEARELGLKRVFVLTFVPEFFEHLGFRPIAKADLPHKIWGECVRCPHFPDCDEVPLAMDL